MNSLLNRAIARRRFIHSAVVLGAVGLWVPRWARAAALPNANPTRVRNLRGRGGHTRDATSHPPYKDIAYDSTDDTTYDIT